MEHFANKLRKMAYKETNSFGDGESSTLKRSYNTVHRIEFE